MARVEVYTTPSCPYCLRAKRLLTERGIAYDEFDVADDVELRTRVTERSGRRTVPLIFVDGQSVGGFDELVALDASGGLAALTRAS
ncbi:MAG: glutaredoxin 3 [Candidatus Binatia bacterium]